MGLRLVNTSPGAAPDLVKPGQPVQLGLKSETGMVDLGSTRVTFGLTSIHHEGLLPEANPNLERRGAVVSVDAAERYRPVGAMADRGISGGNIVISKSSSNPGDFDIYEVLSPIRTGAPVLGFFEFLVDPSWQLTSRQWSHEPVAGVYLGLEHGNFNNACYAFLGSNVINVGGVLQSWGSTRPSFQTLALNWAALAPGSKLGIWVYYNLFGYPDSSPGVPAYTPMVEVWTSIAGATPVRQCRIPVDALGNFPGPHGDTTNVRSGFSDTARLFFGFAGDAGESLTLTDWALFPDYRVSMSEGMALSGSSAVVKPDGPVEYKAADGLPAAVSPGRWMNLSGPGASLSTVSSAYAPGLKKVPTFIQLDKSDASLSGFEKQEPRLENRQGFMVEAFLAGEQTTRASDQFGAGFLVEDGNISCRVSLLQATDKQSYIGLLTDSNTPDLLAAYAISPEVDWTSLKRVRVTGDYLRNKVSFYVEDALVLELPVLYLPLKTGTGRVAFGHLGAVDSRGSLQLASITYLSRFQAWEARDSSLPTTSAVSFDLNAAGDTAVAMADGVLSIAKRSFGVDSSECFYSRSEDFEDTNGLLVDFRVRVAGYTNQAGVSLSAKTWVGAGLDILLGGHRLHLGFFDCGFSNRVIGIIPGSGTVDDIINQTELGRAFSAPVDWTESHSYRLVYKPFDRIEVWVDNFVGQSYLSIPWGVDSFDLPENSDSALMRFGHFDSDSSSVTEWEFVRYGQSNGFEISVQHTYDSYPSYLFGGRIVVLPEFTDSEITE